MKLQDMKAAIDRRVDDVIDMADAVEWLNSGKNQMAVAIEARFPDLVATNQDDTFVFDDRFHEAVVNYAAAMFKYQDSSVTEGDNFMRLFDNGKKEFVENYRVPPQYRDDRLSQQFIATAGQTVFTITKEGYSPRYGDLKVYINDLPYTDFTIDGNTFTLYVLTTIAAGDKITAIWEEHTDLAEPPYPWWGW